MNAHSASASTAASGRKRGLLRVGVLVFAALSMLFTLPVTAAGPGGGGGGGHPTDNTGSLYSELILVLRAVDGTPILKKFVVPPTEEVPEGSTEYCVQPISYEPVSGIGESTNPVDGRPVWVLPLQGEWIGSTDPLPVEEIEPCDPWPQYSMFASEVELERLNLARTDERVLDQKLADVATKLFLGSTVTLEATGRIRIDDKTIDASPENQAIYASLMRTGTIPGLRDGDPFMSTPPAAIGPEGGPGSNSRFEAWELAAMTIGAAASKGTPLTIDAVEYYNRIIGFPTPADPDAVPPVLDYDSPWFAQVPEFVRSLDPSTGTELPDSERFVNYSGFTYNRSETFKGSATWLDVTALQWKVSKIVDLVPFTNLSSYTDEQIYNGQELKSITAFAQLADDVRAMSNFVPDNTFIPGFYMDLPGMDTTLDQLAATTDPAVDLGTLPLDVFKTFPFQVTMSLLNPWGGYTLDGVWWGGEPIAGARLRITIDAADAFVEGDLSEFAADGLAVPFSVDTNGDLVGWWEPEMDPVPPGYNVSTTFDVTIADTAPTGDYSITLDLVTAELPDTELASETGSITVNENAATVLWGDPLPKLATQGGPFTLPLEVYAPADGTAGLTLTITGPGDDPLTTDVVEAMAAGNVKVYGDTGTEMLAMTLTLDEAGKLVGTWDTAVVAGFNPITWHVTVQDGALVGNYDFVVALEGGNTLDAHTVSVAPPAVHGEQPGEFTIAITPVGTPGSNAEFTFEVVAGDDAGVIFQCKLEKDGVLYLEQGDTVEEEWKTCTSPKDYTGLPAGDYEFFARGKRGEVFSPVVSFTWVVTDGGGGGGGGGDTSTTTTTAPAGGGGAGGGEVPSYNVVMTPLAGADRVATAVEVSKEQFPAKAGAAVLANAGVFADALAGTPLAVAEDAPMLLTYTGELDSRVAAELDRVLTPGATVYLLGGAAALSDAVEAAIVAQGYDTVRYAGADRYATSVAIAEGLGNPNTVFLTTGHNFADGLTAGTAAATVDGAVLLTDGDAMAAPVVAHLAAHPAQTRYAVGGPATRADTGAEAIAGADRFATAAMVAGKFFPTPAFVGMVSGEKFPDALSGGVASAMHGGPLMLSASNALSTATAQYLAAHAQTIEEVQFYGGPAALSQAARDAVVASLG